MGEENKDENQDRGNWDNKADYLLSCIGYAVGLGNVWRFPYLAFENGGGAFLIPYIIMLVFAGLPIFFMEVALGQFSSLGPTSVWKFNPMFKGVGVCMVVLSAFVGIYYNVIIAYTMFYFFSSLTSNLPWETCDNWWNDGSICSISFGDVCPSINVSSLTAQEANQIGPFTANLTYDSTTNLYSQVPKDIAGNIESTLSRNLSTLGCPEFVKGKSRGVSPTEEYWKNYALHQAPNINTENTGVPNVNLTLSLIVAWIVVFYSLIRGIKSSGKVVYFTALFPYVVLLILLIRGATLEGAYDGVQYYIGSQSDLSKLKDANVWKAAATQIFFSLSAAWGGLIALSSYNKFKNNCFFDAVLVCSVNCATSLFAGFAIFTVLGHMAFKLGKPVNEVVQSSFGLAFVVYPEAIAKLPISPLWAILFFLMLFTLGLDSQFTILETVSTAIIDSFPRQLRNRRWQLMLLLSVVMFLLGLVCVTDAGIYWVDLIDHYAAGWGLLFVAVMELFGVCYIYGGNRFIEDIEMMIGKKNWWFWLYWRACWFFISPLLLIAILVWSLVTFEPMKYADKTPYPAFATAIGWLIIATALLFIPVYALVSLVKNKWSLYKASSPAADWGPYIKQFRGTRYANMAEPAEALEIAKGRTDGKDNPNFAEDEIGNTKL
uniref:sodium- and chloride-dependent neutral and basic amino acid transporter B(0+) n=1 Tax=Ciona intestinalis TaxID=7719 RepID=UPI000180D065|nr:sodium- and chloride-dependent neutral and basic amino acid transporter B(0+) [Ciona intestinalis]|eukprot:XP_018670765.1 sodium- and chloride-dependent neutral and basic amino acid transporter B(0+) [Ciona intestinalis]